MDKARGGGKVAIYPACTRRLSQHNICISTSNLHIPHCLIGADKVAVQQPCHGRLDTEHTARMAEVNVLIAG